VRIAADGELLVARSALTFSGYWRKPEATQAAFTADGEWLRTGDRAEQDADGVLRITGRVKELIALSTGRKIAPLPIEAALASSPYIAHAVCYGEGRKYLVALLSLRRTVVEAWAREQQVNVSWPALAHEPAVRALVDEIVTRVNAELARTDRIVRVAITDVEFTLERGELTPTLKVLRGVIAQRFVAVFEALYV
jgi:long-chain acyl-CoA synthetase